MRSSGVVLLFLFAVVSCQIDLSGILGDLSLPTVQQVRCIIESGKRQILSLFWQCGDVNIQNLDVSVACMMAFNNHYLNCRSSLFATTWLALDFFQELLKVVGIMLPLLVSKLVLLMGGVPLLSCVELQYVRD